MTYKLKLTQEKLSHLIVNNLVNDPTIPIMELCGIGHCSKTNISNIDKVSSICVLNLNQTWVQCSSSQTNAHRLYSETEPYATVHLPPSAGLQAMPT